MHTALLQALQDIHVLNSMKCVSFKFRLAKPQKLKFQTVMESAIQSSG